MYVGIDVGGTNIRIASFETLHPSTKKGVIKLKTTNDYIKDINNIYRAILDLTKSQVSGMGIGIPGVLNKAKTQILHANNLKSWQGQSIVNDLKSKFNCKVVLENDATTAALGEALFGKGVARDFLFIIWGTGIGGTFVRLTNNQVYTISSELGHQIVEWNGIHDTCGQKGCLEAYCGGRGIEKRYGKPAKDLTENEWGEVEQYFAHGLLNILTIYPSEFVIFSGSIAINQKNRLANIETIIRDKLKIFHAPRLLSSQYGNDVALYGAIGLLKK